MSKPLVSLIAFFIITPFIALADDVGTSDVQVSSSASAQAQPSEEINVPMIRIATVNVYDARVSKQTEDFFEVSYEAHNREGIQADIFSSLAVIDAKGYIVPLHRSKEAFTLGNDQKSTRTERIDIPSYLKGDYDAIMVFATSSGVTLANVSLGKVTFSGTGNYVRIEGCSLSVSGDEKEYDTMQGVDAGKDEVLTANCLLRNLSSESVTATPHLTEYWRSPFGPKLSEYAVDAVTIEAGAQKNLNFEVRKNANPQSYTQSLVLLGSDKAPVSTPVEFHYVVRGESATIQNIVFDKDTYRKGETAKVTFGWSGSADAFFGSRKSDGTLVSGVAMLEISDSGVLCSKSQEMPFSTSEKMDYIHKEASLTIDKDCFAPVLNVIILDKSGKTLDARRVSAPVGENVISLPKQTESSTKKMVMWLVLFCFIMLLLVFFSKKRRSLAAMFFLVSGSVLGISAMPAGEAEADTYSFSPDGKTYTVTVNHNKSTFSPSETAQLTSSISAQACYNGWNAISGTLNILSPQNKQINYWDKANFNSGSHPNCVNEGYFMGHAHYRCNTGFIANNFVVQNAPGSYNASYRLTMYYYNYSYRTAYGDFVIPYTVTSPAASCGTAHTRTMGGNSGPTNEGYSLCSSGNSNGGHPGTEPGGNSPYALFTGGAWSGWDWDCIGSNSRYCYACRPGYISNGSTCVPACTPSCANAPNVCSGVWFSDGCGGNCWGTKYCPPAPTLNFWADSTSLAYNGATTLRWNSTNATSCTASGNWSGGKAVNGAEGTGNLTSSRTYTLTCSGPGGSISRSVVVNVALPPLGTPTGLQANCNAAGNQVTLSWNGVSGATMYPLRVNDQTNGWDGSCSAPDQCADIYATSYTRAVVPGRNYGWWVHAYRAADGAGSGAAIGSDFRCHAPVTVSGRVFNQSTGAGYAGVSIPACAATPATTTDASGNFSFSVPYDAGYCIRLNPEARAGTTGPVPTGYPASLQATMTTYEYQRAGVNCATAGCGGAWDTYDRSTDTGFNFAYTNLTPRLIICPATVSIAVGGSANLEARYWANLASVPDCNTTGYTAVTPSSTWTSGSPAIATVTNSGTKGVATGVSAGTATISALYSGITATRNVTVTAAPASASCSINPVALGGGQYRLNYSITWDSTNRYTYMLITPGNQRVDKTSQTQTGSVTVTPSATTTYILQTGTVASPAPPGWSCQTTVTPPAPPTLGVAVSANPASGNAPLASVITATVSGTATGTINYHFYCDGTTLTRSYLGQSATSMTHTCNYATAGNYSPKVEVERSTAPRASGTANVNVSNPSPMLTVSLSGGGSGNGRVTSSPAGIDCGSDCSESYALNTNVTLTAAASALGRFNSWSGACSGSVATCTVRMDAAKSVTAVFDAVPPCTCRATDDDDYCKGKTYTNSCGNTCNGSKNCDAGPYKEVTP